jgi:hypothetical protein
MHVSLTPYFLVLLGMVLVSVGTHILWVAAPGAFNDANRTFAKRLIIVGLALIVLAPFSW